MVPRNSTAIIVLSSVVREGSGGGGGVPPNIHCPLHCFDGDQLQSVGILPGDQLFTISDESDDCCGVCTLQEFNRSESLMDPGTDLWAINLCHVLQKCQHS